MSNSESKVVVQQAAPASMMITIITLFTCLFTIAVFVATFFLPWTTVPIAALLTLLLISCYYTTPVAYEIANGNLKVTLRRGAVRYKNVVSCSRLESSGISFRLFGNGGLFGGTGIYWSRSIGIFRAWVTRASERDMIMVMTSDKKIIMISPCDPEHFLESYSKVNS